MDWQPGDNAMSWVFASPLHPFIDAAYWVHVFFIISGIVLTLPVVHAAKKFSWKAYYPRRLVRIYLPVFAAVLLALLWVVSIDRTNMRSPFFTWDQGSMAPHAEDFPSLHYVLDDMLLLGRPGHIDIPLWSLHFEILFSLLLPVAIWIGVKGQKLFVPLILACLLIISASQSVYFTYGALMPLFGIGVLMAVRYPTLQEWADRITNHRRGNWMWGGLALTGFLLLGSHWTQYAFGGNMTIRNAMQGVSDLGVVLLIFTAIFCRPVVRVLSARPIQFLGVMAFSTYLVHEPVVTGIAALFGEGNQFWAMPAPGSSPPWPPCQPARRRSWSVRPGGSGRPRTQLSAGRTTARRGSLRRVPGTTVSTNGPRSRRY